MQVSTVRADDAPKSEFKLPEGVTRGEDGNLVDNRSFYQGWRTLGNTSLSTLKKESDKAEQEKAQPKEDGYTLMTPFNFVGRVFSKVFAVLGKMTSSILGICGYGKKDQPAAHYHGETSEFKLPKGVQVSEDGTLVDCRPWYQRIFRDNSTSLEVLFQKF